MTTFKPRGGGRRRHPQDNSDGPPWRAVGSDYSQTVISGPVTDQAALHGLLNRVCDLGLVIVSVRRLEPE